MSVTKPLKKSFVIPVLLIVFSIGLIACAEFLQSTGDVNPENYIRQAEKKLGHLEQKMSNSLDEIAAITSDSGFHTYFIHRGFQEIGFSFFYIENETVTKWSDNETNISSAIADTCINKSLIHLNNGWYEIFLRKEKEKEIIGLLLIAKEYAYENQYLVNSFNPRLGLPGYSTIDETVKESSLIVRSLDNKPLFNVRFLNAHGDSLKFGLISWLYILSFLIFLVTVFLFIKIFASISSALAYLFMILVLGARGVMIHLQIPDEFYSTPLFSPRFYASSFYFNSLGDLCINVLLLFCLAGGFYSVFSGKDYHPNNKFSASLIRTGSLIFILLLSLPINNLISGLIVNSKISFDFSNIFAMNENSLLGVLVIALLLWTYFLLAFALLKRFFCNTGIKNFSVLMLVAIVIFVLVYFSLARSEWIQSFNPAILPALAVGMLAAVFTRVNADGKKINFHFLLYITLLFSISSSFVIRELNDRKEKENRKLIVQKIETGQDRLAEYLFEDIGKKISNDGIIRQQFRDSTHLREQVSKRLMQFYFSGYWGKFNINIFCFEASGLSFDTIHTNFTLDLLGKKIPEKEKQNGTNSLYFLGNESEQPEYIAIIPVHENRRSETVIGSIAILMTPRLFQSDIGFPELFVSRKVAFNRELTKYSYARYRNDSLLNQSGDFAYYFSAKIFHPSSQEYSFSDLDNYNHLIHRFNDNSFVIVSRIHESSLLFFTLFSYLFSFFSLLVFVFYFCWHMVNREAGYRLNLTRRIQASVMSLVILSFILIGSGTVYYITKKYDLNKDESIREKINALLTVLEKESGDASGLDTRLTEENQASFGKLSGMFGTDFNIFNPEGNLYYSSQPKIFEQGIISQKMNPEVLFEMKEKGKTQFVHPESIGKLNYISAYEPLRNKQGKMIGYLHIPYFEKENELNNEISNFLSALINIYVLLLALAVIITLIISSRITQPLLLIQEKLSNIRLGRKNELIEYSRKDEIGELVNEYNRMIDELAASAKKLAKSERESAWREMAKQVAHEIKNPLTPMKLSVQHLQKAWEEKSPKLPEIFHRISQTLVEQIDTLSNIATEFSNFAQMPQAIKEAVDLNKIIGSALDLYKELPDISIVVSGDQKDKYVFADKNQLMRMFSNLLKNATQAIESGKKGVIEVSVSTDQNNHIISVRDNGAGIPLAQRERIFTPNFTTKSSGMGLGLSIVKSIVESSGGTIRFETEEGLGTTFFISLPAYQN